MILNRLMKTTDSIDNIMKRRKKNTLNFYLKILGASINRNHIFFSPPGSARMFQFQMVICSEKGRGLLHCGGAEQRAGPL